MNQSIVELSRLAREDGRRYPKRRFVYPVMKKFAGEREFVALIGPRGAGKTVILKQFHAESHNTLYVSLDVTKPDRDLFSLAKDASQQGITILLLDEIHYYPEFAGELKKIYDFLRIQILCTSSCAIDLQEISYDLSRRLRMLYVFPFLFREFLYFEEKLDTRPLTMDELIDEDTARKVYGETLHAEPLFSPYLQGRNYPFTLETSEWHSLFRAMLETILHKDLVLTGLVTPEESMEIRRLCSFIGQSQAEGISYSSCSANCGITKYKAEKYVTILEKAFILNRVFPKGTNVTREPKILMALPYRLLYKSFEECIGALREDYFVETLRILDYPCEYLKSNRGAKTPDYVVGNTAFEIGGASKKASQLKGWEGKQRLLLVEPGTVDAVRRPLLLTGFLESRS